MPANALAIASYPPTDLPIKTATIRWWDCGLPCPQPNELFAFAALHDPDAIHLQTLEELERVAEAYIVHCRKIGYWAHSKIMATYHAAGEQGYRDRLRDYKAILAYFLQQAHGETPVIPDWK